MLPPCLSTSWLVAAVLQLLVVSAATPPATTFENTAVVRSIDLGGATTQITTSYQVRSLKDDNALYIFAIPDFEAEKISWIEAKVKGGQTPLEVTPYGDASKGLERAKMYSINLPKPLRTNESATIILNIVQSHVSTPLPASIGQKEPQTLLHETGIYVISPYDTLIQRTKIRSPTPTILAYTEEITSPFAETGSHPVTKSGTTVTYGPFRSTPRFFQPPYLSQTQQLVRMHYQYDAPVLRVPYLKRAAEISHWGSNLNIQDEVQLVNDGAKLKGFFSRLEEIKQKFNPHTKQSHVLRDIVLHLPTGVRDIYYYDVIGNVSHSHFRPAETRYAAGRRASPLERSSILEFKPRYPLMGGWNYTYTQGYDLPLQEWAGYDAKRGAYVVAVPFFNPIDGAAYDDVEVKVILPEGSKLLEYHTPFSVDETLETTHVTYLDTLGRPTVIFRKKAVNDKHAKPLYVVYSVDAKAHLQKPLAVAAACFALFTLYMSLHRLDISIHTKKLV